MCLRVGSGDGHVGVELFVRVCGWMRLALRVMPQGYPVYGPFGYEGPVDTGSGVVRIRSSYVLKVRVRVSDCGLVPGAWCLVPGVLWP